ncbi:MAG: helix-turn-helix domain-containing protein [Halobacteriaceae archaeon]
MSIVAEFEIRSPDLTLAPTFDAIDGVTYDLVTEAATDPERPVLFFWVSAPDFDAFEAALDDDPTVTDVTRHADEGDRRLYRVRLTENVEVVLYPLWARLGADLLHARFRDGWWQFRVRFPDRDAVGTIRDWFADHGVEFRLQSVVQAAAIDADEPLSAAQAEALELAFERGYFAVPREASLGELADELDVTAQAVSERLRRGTANLLADHFDGDPIA